MYCKYSREGGHFFSQHSDQMGLDDFSSPDARGALGLLKVSELVKGRAFCHKTLLQRYKWQSYPKYKVRSALCAASQLPKEGPNDVEQWKMRLHLH